MPPSPKCLGWAFCQPPKTSSMVNRLTLGKSPAYLLADLGQPRPVVVLGRDLLPVLAVEVLEVRLGHGPRAALVHRPCRRRSPAARPGCSPRAPRSRTCPAPAPSPRGRPRSPRRSARRRSRAARTSSSTRARPNRARERSCTAASRSPAPWPRRPCSAGGHSPSGEVIPPRAARGLGVRRDHRHAGLHQVVPVLDALGIALAHEEHDGRGVGRAVVRQPRLPVRRDQLGLLGAARRCRRPGPA